MEGLKKRIYWVSAALLVVGVSVLSMPDKKPVGRTEAWMETQAPVTVDGYGFRRSKANPEQTDRMDPRTYELLNPFGIVCRTYEYGSAAFQVVLIASNNRSSFHDPRVCFAGQGWNFDQQSRVIIPTRTRGNITATLIAGKADNGARQSAIYFYRGPGGFSSSTFGIKARLMFTLLLHPFDGPGEAVFYRFICEDQDVSSEDFVKFVSSYMDAAKESSNGYF